MPLKPTQRKILFYHNLSVATSAGCCIVVIILILSPEQEQNKESFIQLHGLCSLLLVSFLSQVEQNSPFQSDPCAFFISLRAFFTWGMSRWVPYQTSSALIEGLYKKHWYEKNAEHCLLPITMSITAYIRPCMIDSF